MTKNQSPLHKLLIFTSILVLGLTTISTSINSKAEQAVQWNQTMLTNPEAILNIQFKDNIFLDNIVDNELTSIKNNQGYTINQQDYIINGLSGVSNIGGTDQMITIFGNYSTNNLQQEYKNKLTEVITQVDDIKNNNSQLDNISSDDKTKLDKQLSRMNGVELKTQRYWSWGEDKILSLSIMGNTNTLYSLKGILENTGHTTMIQLTEMSVIQKQIDDMKNATQSMSEEQKKEYLKKYLEETTKQELAKLGITSSFEEYMKQEYDKLPEYQKEPIQGIVEDLETVSIETVSSKMTVGFVNGITAKAGACQNDFRFNFENPVWGTSKLYLNRCAVGQLKMYGIWGTGLAWILGYTACSAFCALLASIIGIYTGWLEYVDSRCDNGGAIISMRSAIFWINQRC